MHDKPSLPGPPLMFAESDGVLGCSAEKLGPSHCRIPSLGGTDVYGPSFLRSPL